MERDKEVIDSQSIEKATAEFLAKGGKIERLPTKRKAPKSKKWIARLGRDYTPWDRL